ncbi:outer membrane protein [Citromicrobium bathyomarinum]|uniref:outer membrane protein n=1 Tax=Citromicrobium bathyomarinum TaxID=72174 RepID=UPI00315AA638
MKPAYFIAAAFAGALLPSAAFAQDATPAEVTLGVTAGYHDLGISDEVYDLTGVEVDDGSPIFGGFASVDFPVSDSIFIGAEGNLSIGTDAIDSDYGASARLGYRTQNGTKVYVRGGYQWVELDYANMLNVDKSAIPAGLDDTVGDYLVGGGVDVPIGSKAMFRVNVDTISFDTLRATAGVGFRF